MVFCWKRVATATIGSVLVLPFGSLLHDGHLSLESIHGIGITGEVAQAQAQTQRTFAVGEQVVVKLETGYYLATVDKVYQENGFTMVDFSWQVTGGTGRGTYPADYPNFWFTVAEARRRKFVIANAAANRSRPVPKPSPTNAPVRNRPVATSSPTPPPTTEQSGQVCPGMSQVTRAEIEEILRIHNQARAEVGVPPLTWNCQLADFSQQWVNRDQWEHSSSADRRQVIANSYIGENLASAAPASQPIATIGPMGWWDEKQFWNNATGNCQAGKVCGHYTQMVWRDTKEVGCGVNRQASVLGAAWRGNSAYLACTYNPGGNYTGQKPY